MAFSLRLVTSNFIARSISASRLFCIYAGHRSYTTMPKDDFSDHSWINVQCPKISSLSFKMQMSAKTRRLSLTIPNEDLTVDLGMPGLKLKEMRACAEQTLFIQGITNKKDYIKLPNKASSSDHIEEEMKDGILEATTDLNKDGIIFNIIANEIISSFRDMTAERGWAYYDMFYDQSILGKGLCPIIRELSSINSFTLCKEETAGHLYITMKMPGFVKMKSTTHGLRVSVKMVGVKRGHVKAYYDYDTFFIEGKTMKKHYITGIRLPEGFEKKSNMIRKEMEDGEFHAFLLCDVKKLELEDHLKLKLYITS